MNMIRKNNNRDNRGGNKHRNGGNNGGARRYNNNGGGNRNSGANDSQNLQRQKHHATQQLGKYNDLARNAQINGDRVDVEYYLQHVDHYTRVLTDIASVEAERYAHQRESQIIPGGPNDPNAQQHHHSENNNEAPQAESANTAPQDATTSSNDNDTNGNSNPPRMSRQRRPQHSNPHKPSDNGSAEANSNTAEIPLPGGILPPI